MSDLNPARPITSARQRWLTTATDQQLADDRAHWIGEAVHLGRAVGGGALDFNRAAFADAFADALADALDDLADVDAEIARRKPTEAGR